MWHIGIPAYRVYPYFGSPYYPFAPVNLAGPHPSSIKSEINYLSGLPIKEHAQNIKNKKTKHNKKSGKIKEIETAKAKAPKLEPLKNDTFTPAK